MAVVYLTFDDGPLGGTDDVIAVLNAKRAKGTLFLVGDHVSSDWRRRQLDAAHSSEYIEVANHSTTHASGDYSGYYGNPRGVLEGFQAATQTLRITQRPVPARLPGRNTWRVGSIVHNDPTNRGDSGGAANLLAGAGYRIYGWDVEWQMSRGRPQGTADSVVQRIDRMAAAGSVKKAGHVVLLTHDVMFRASNHDRGKLERLIDLLRAAGHSFAFISDFDGSAAG